jgi:acetyl-CoA carboxylase carboxyl transferase subunit alpha
MAISPSSNGLNGTRTPFGVAANGYLEFEKPLIRIEQQISELENLQIQTGRDHSEMIKTVRAQLLAERKKIFAGLSAWETVLVARHPKRPLVTHYIDRMVKDFVELKGDRNYRDDKAIITGFGRIAGHKVMLIGHNKGRDTKERIENCFGMAHPEGYRKALLKMRLAEKFRLPVVCLIDTAGAYPGIGAEERGIAQAIAYNLQVMPLLRTPIICIVIGEGGSGGALGIGVGDRVAVLEHAYYSVISPEGCAAILWKSGEYASQAAEALRLTSKELKRLKLVDDIIREPLGGAHQDHAATAEAVSSYINETLRDLKRVRIDTLLKRRYQRLRNLGSFFTTTAPVTEQPAAKPRPRVRASRSVAVPASSGSSLSTVPMLAKS